MEVLELENKNDEIIAFVWKPKGYRFAVLAIEMLKFTAIGNVYDYHWSMPDHTVNVYFCACNLLSECGFYCM